MAWVEGVKLVDCRDWTRNNNNKVLMYDFHYNFIKQWYWPNTRLLFTRTNTVYVIRSKPIILSCIRTGSFSTSQSTQLITPSTSRQTRKSLERWTMKRHFSRSQSLCGCGKKCTASRLSSTKARSRKPIVWKGRQKNTRPIIPITSGIRLEDQMRSVCQTRTIRSENIKSCSAQ